MGNQNDKQIKDELDVVFRKLDEVPFTSNPYLASRVMANLRDRRKQSVPRIWKSVAFATTGLSFFLLVGLIVSNLRGVPYEAFVNRSFVVKMEVSDLKTFQIAKAEIQLPDGVYFDVEEFPELREKRTLTLKWRNRESNEFVPIVLTGDTEGIKRITVIFYDENDQLVGQKSLDIRLRKGADNG